MLMREFIKDWPKGNVNQWRRYKKTYTRVKAEWNLIRKFIRENPTTIDRLFEKIENASGSVINILKG